VQAWKGRNPQAVAANLTIAREVRARNITPPATCEAADCNHGDRLQAHHNSYHKPRSVIWLCARHHRRLHNGHRVKLKPTAAARYAKAPKTK
jgi:hypothetical protein